MAIRPTLVLATLAAALPARAETEARAAPVHPEAATLEEALRDADLQGTPTAAPPLDEAPAAQPDGPRQAPDYDGRPDPTPAAAEIFLWVPRVVFFPVYLLLEYALRRPLITFSSWAESHYVFARVVDFLRWDNGRALLLPRAFVDFGFKPAIGLTLHWNDILPGNDLRVAFSGWSDVFYGRLATTTRLLADDSLVLRLEGGYQFRGDNKYVPPGPRPSYCLKVDGCRYYEAVGDLRTYADFRLGELDHVLPSLSWRHVALANGTSAPRLPPPLLRTLPGFPDYELLVAQLDSVLDTRHEDVRFIGQSGVRLAVTGSFSVDPASPGLRFVRYGGEASGFLNVGWNNVLGATFFISLTENLSAVQDGQRVPIPFTEKVLLGDLEHMPGLTEGRVRGNDAWVVSLHYVWPIWWALEARLFADIGAAYSSLPQATWGDTYLSYGIGLRHRSGPVGALEALIALGSSRFDRPGGLDLAQSVRLTLGINHGI